MEMGQGQSSCFPPCGLDVSRWRQKALSAWIPSLTIGLTAEDPLSISPSTPVLLSTCFASSLSQVPMIQQNKKSSYSRKQRSRQQDYGVCVCISGSRALGYHKVRGQREGDATEKASGRR